MCLEEPLAWIFGFFPVADWLRHIADGRQNQKKPYGKSKADIEFRGKLTFDAGARNCGSSHPVTKSVFPFVGRQRSGSRPSRCALNFWGQLDWSLESKRSAGFVGVFIPVWKFSKVAEIKATSHSPEELMSSLSRSAQIIPQVLRYTLR